MKSITMFETSWCPHCKQAHIFMDEIKNENPRYNDLNIQYIDEDQEPDIAGQYDYYYVPTYYLDTVKFHEGIPNKEVLRTLFEKALSL